VQDAFKAVTRDVARRCEKGEFHASETRKKQIIRLVLDTPTIELFCISMTRSKGTTGCDSTTKLSSTADPNRSRFTSFCICSIPSF
jgi:predicted methyltransferase